MKQKTTWTRKENIERKWYIVDVSDLILGRASTQIASLLIGKGKVDKTPSIDAGDYVIVINSDKVKLTREKAGSKTYFRHSGYPGGAKTITFEKQMIKDSRFVIQKAVKNMLPQNKHKDLRMSRLYVYKDEKHKHNAQIPVEFNLSGK